MKIKTNKNNNSSTNDSMSFLTFRLISNSLKNKTMKKIIISAVILAFVAVSCNQKGKQTETIDTPMMDGDSTMMMKDSTMMERDSTMVKDADSKIYACPMHPEIQGKSTDTCSKCGMDLTEEVK